jgi:hypothetical protein
MTKGQEIARRFALDVYYDQCCAAIDAAIAEAVSKTRVECAELPIPFVGDRHCPHYIEGFEAGLRQYRSAILAPPAPAYPFGLDASGRQCADWRPVSGTILTSWCRGGRDTPIEYLRTTAAFCEVCGAPRMKGI